MDKRLRPFIVPIFISNQGCPHRCIFCDQGKITGEMKIGAKDVEGIVETAIRSKRFKKEQGMEVAFYGGTFTNLPVAYMRELLGALQGYVKKGIVKKIRVSTRPDSVTNDVLNTIKGYGVEIVELGAQSLNDNVLRLSKRGHSVEDTLKASFLLRKMGFKVGIQLMPGLPGDNEKVFMETINRVINLKPDMVRLYPTVIIRGTELEQLYLRGEYQPLRLNQAVDMCTDAVIRLEENSIPVIRIGLMHSESLMKNMLAGPWHPAFGFLVRSKVFIKEHVLPRLKKIGKKNVNIFAPPNSISLIKGYRNEGLKMIELETGINISSIFADQSLSSDIIKVEEL